jgi:predicted phage terminase large subunit-like protein
VRVSENELIASICRDSFWDFLQEFWDTVVPEPLEYNWHIEYLCNDAQETVERMFKGLPKEHDTVINISPGTSKSSIYSIMLPGWIWTRMPTARFIGGSYSFPLAMDLSRKSRDVVLSDKYRACFPDVKLREDQNAKHHFANTKGGYRYAVGVNGTVTGMHAHVIVVDDPLDPQEALSKAQVDSANHWLDQVLPSRKVNKAVTPTFLVMQRLAVEDPTNLFLNRKHTKHICIPAELTDDVRPRRLRKYYQKRLMDPKRLGRVVLDEAREKGSFYYSGQFLQNPVPLGGGMFIVDRLKYVEPHHCPKQWKRLVRNWDKAGTLDGGAFTVGVLLGWDLDNRVFILDVVRFQKDSFEREKIIRSTAMADGRAVIIGVEQEPGSGGKESAESTVRNLIGFRVRIHRPNKADGSKAERADPFAVQVNAGNVYLKVAHWNRDFVRELQHFPMSRLKDQVDAASGGWAILSQARVRVGGMKKRAELQTNTFASVLSVRRK